MSKYIHQITPHSVILFVDGRPNEIDPEHVNFNKIIEGLRAVDKGEGDYETVLALLDERNAFNQLDIEGFAFDGEKATYKGYTLCGSLLEHARFVITNDLGVERFSKFLDNLFNNPSSSSVNELMDFLNYKRLPIDEDGYVIGYKGVNQDEWSCTGNTDTVVKQGQVDERGRILNTNGAVIEVARNQVDDNRDNNCSHGLHVGSWDYASDFGVRVKMVRFNPRDAVSVPTDCRCQKIRVCKYEVLRDVERETKVYHYDDSKDLDTQERDERYNDIAKHVRSFRATFPDISDEVIATYLEDQNFGDFDDMLEIVAEID